MSEPRTFRKRPVEIQAIQFDGTNHDDIQAFAAGCFTIDIRTDTYKPGIVAEVWDKLHHTWVGVKVGDWIVRGVAGEFYPVDAAVMAQTYEEVCDA